MDARSQYREHDVQTNVSPIRLVIALYEQAIADVRRALAAMESGNIELRTQEISHALLVIGHLQSTLDLEAGGDVGGNLDRFYSVLRAGLMEAQLRQDPELLQRQLELLLSVREAWLSLDAQGLQHDSGTTPVPEDYEEDNSTVASSGHWSA